MSFEGQDPLFSLEGQGPAFSFAKLLEMLVETDYDCIKFSERIITEGLIAYGWGFLYVNQTFAILVHSGFR